jgi:hypothetical protein
MLAGPAEGTGASVFFTSLTRPAEETIVSVSFTLLTGPAEGNVASDFTFLGTPLLGEKIVHPLICTGPPFGKLDITVSFLLLHVVLWMAFVDFGG